MSGDTHSRFEEKWRPRVGDRATRLYRRAGLMVGLQWAPGLVFVILLALSVTSRATTLYIVTGVAGASWLAGVVTMVIAFHRAFAAMSEHLGFHVWIFNSPPGRDEQYEAWCARNRARPGGPAKST